MPRRSERATLVVCLCVLACVSGQLTYTPPAPTESARPTVTINRSRADVWRSLIPELGRTFFVINNLDQSSGFVNVSYSGNPERFVDCGLIISDVSNLRGPRTYKFPAASAEERYEVTAGEKLYGVIRTMALEGRANIILEEVSATVTRVTVNTRYVLTKRMVYTAVSGASSQETETITFGFGERSAFPAGTTCQSTGALENQLLGLLGKPTENKP
jgi:hypothetical protein